MELDVAGLLTEVKLRFTRSSGKGGQNVNKVSSKAELYFDVNASLFLDEEQKVMVLEKNGNIISDKGILKLTSSEARTQLENKKTIKEKFIALLKKALTKNKKRKPTKIPFQVKEKRLEGKKIKSETKKLRSKII